MKRGLILLGMIVCGLAVASIYLWRELLAERARNAELSTRLDSPPALIAPPEVAVLTAPAPAPALPAALSPDNPVDTESPRPAYLKEEDQEEANQRRLMQQPKYREAWRAQQRLAYARRRENVIRLLGFTPEQADAIVELAIDRQLSWYDRAPAKPMNEADAQQQQALYERDEREHQAKLRELLGEEKRAQFQEYMESRETRIQVDQLRPQFTGADALRDDQVEPLIKALHAERATMRQELSELRETLNLDDPAIGQQFNERQVELLRATYERMHSAAAPILSSSQLARLDVLLKRDLDRQEAERGMELIQSR